MIEDMTLADFSPKTQQAYIYAVKQLATHDGRSPDLLGEQKIRRYSLHMVNKRKLARSTVHHQHLCGVKFATFDERPLGVARIHATFNAVSTRTLRE